MTDKFRILLVEEDPINIKVMHGIVRHHRHFSSDTATDSESAKTKIRENPPYHAVITDIGVDGLEILKTARGRSPDTKVFIVAGFGDQNALIDAIKMGAWGYLHKPYRPEELNLALFNVTQHFQNVDALAQLQAENTELTSRLAAIEAEKASLIQEKAVLEKQLLQMKSKNDQPSDLNSAIAAAAQKRAGQANHYTIHRELTDLAKLLDAKQISREEFHEIRRGLLEKAYKIPIPLSSA